jgi:hypothetical protein
MLFLNARSALCELEILTCIENLETVYLDLYQLQPSFVKRTLDITKLLLEHSAKPEP